MRDEENSNIEYRQISVPATMTLILWIALLILGSGFLVFLLVGAIQNNTLITIILYSVAIAYLIFSLVINSVVLHKVLAVKYDDNPVKYMTLVFISLNIFSGFVMLREHKKNREYYQ